MLVRGQQAKQIQKMEIVAVQMLLLVDCYGHNMGNCAGSSAGCTVNLFCQDWHNRLTEG